MMTEENPIIKIKIDESNSNEYNESNGGTTLTDLHEVEFSILPVVDSSDERKLSIYNEIDSIDSRLESINKRVDELNAEIDTLTNHADWLDCTVSVASGIIAGIIDSLWVGEFSFVRANEWGTEKVNKFITFIAKKQGYDRDDLKGAVEHLEGKFPISADKVTNSFGGGSQHHLRDFSHHPTPVGLFFSMLTQFTGNVYGTDVAGVFKIVPVGEDGFHLIGNNIPEKITLGFIHWFFHLVSDMAGAKNTIAKGGTGTGIPGPLVSLLKEISALPIFKKMDQNGRKEFSVWISKLFNGTLLGKRDENGKLIQAIKFDLRTEIGVAHEIGRQAVPVVINECIVRGFYFIRRLIDELKLTKITKVSDLKKINWQNTLPIKNRTIVRMLNISLATFTAIDIADAAIRSGGFNAACILRVNFVGIGRFAFAIGTDVYMGVKKTRKESEQTALIGERLELLNAKVFYKQADTWIEAQNTKLALEEVSKIMEQTTCLFNEAWNDIKEESEECTKHIESIRNNNKELTNELIDILKF